MRAIAGSGPLGVLLAVLLAGWVLLSHPGAPAGPAMAGLLLAGVGAWAAGGLLARIHPCLPGVGVAVVAGTAMLIGVPDSISGTPLAAPLGYANANAALLTAGVAGLLAAAGHTPDGQRRKLVGAAVVLTLLALVTGSRAGAAACVLLLVAWHLLARGRAVLWQLSAAALIVLAVGATVTLGASQQDRPTALVDTTVSTARTTLWSDAVRLGVDQPVRGVGPGAFEASSPTAQRDPDLNNPHSMPLQVVAELGFTGLALLAAVAAWMVGALGRGAVLMSAMALQPTVDYVLDFPAVVLASALVLGGIAVSGIGKPGLTPPVP
ncbi:MAG: hypothetical protein GEU96_00520 [Propionibacteriales bacterium]|nr:hypothetical protein [Propionibacteriales bacterium]